MPSESANPAALRAALAGTGIEVGAGEGGLLKAASRPADWVMAAIVGAAGLKPTLEAVRQGTATALANGTCEVLRARTLREAVVILQIKDVGVIVAEANAESEDVALFLKLLKQKYPETVTLLVTPTADAEGAIELINQAQLFRFLAPPVTPAVLKDSLDAAISHSVALRATPELLARHTVQAVSKEREAQAGGWLLDGLRTLRSRLGLSAG